MNIVDLLPSKKRSEAAFSDLCDSFKAARASKQPAAGNLVAPMYFGYGATGYQGSGISYYTLMSNYKSWVYTCTTKIMNSVAMLPMKLIVYRNSTGTKVAGSEIKSIFRTIKTARDKRTWLKSNNLKREEIFEHSFLELMKRPNHIDTRYSLWANIVLRLELCGTSGIYVVSDGLGIPRELWSLPITKTATLRPIPDRVEMISGYRYEDGGKVTNFTRDEIVFLKYVDPASPFEGMSALKAQLYPYDIDTFLEKQQYYLLKNRAVFGNVLGTDQQLKGLQVEELKALLLSQYQGAVNSGNPLVLHSGLKLQENKLGATIQDLMVAEVEQFAQDKLLSAYGTPAGKLGLVKDVNRANMEALDETYYQDCIKPKTMMIEEHFEAFILPRYDEALTLDFDLPERDERDTDIKERETNLRMKYTTINEERDKEGKDPVAWGDAPWGSFVEVQLGAARPAPEKTDGSTEPNGNQPAADPTEKQFKSKTGLKSKSGLTKEFWTPERKAIAWKSYVATHSQFESIFTDTMQSYFAGQKTRLLDSLHRNYKSIHSSLAAFNKDKKRQVLARMCEKKDLADQIAFDRSAEEKRLAETVEPIYKGIMQTFGQQRLDFLSGNMKSTSGSQLGETKAEDLGFEYNVNDESALKWLGERMEMFSKEVTGTSLDEIKQILREGFTEGKPAASIAADLDERFVSWEKYRAQAIARTETTAASNQADLDAVDQAGLSDQLNKGWLTAGDGHERETHAAAGAKYADGIPLNENFHVGSDTMSAPGNGSEAGENINCRCSLIYVEK